MKSKLKNRLYYIIGGGLCALCVLFAILLTCMSCKKVTLGKNYTYKLGVFGDDYSIEVTATFDDENYITYDAFVGTESTTITTRYKISSDGNLYIKSDNDDWGRIGKVNAYRIELDNSAINNEYGLNLKIVLQCKSAKIAMILYIVLISITLVSGISYIVAQTKINKKLTISEETEVLD